MCHNSAVSMHFEFVKMSSKRSKGATGVDNTHRKIWDRSEYHEKAQERDREVCMCEE